MIFHIDRYAFCTAGLRLVICNKKLPTFVHSVFAVDL